MQRRFAREIKARELGDFPKKIRPRYLENLYFDIELRIPKALMLGMGLQQVTARFRIILGAARNFLRCLNIFADVAGA